MATLRRSSSNDSTSSKPAFRSSRTELPLELPGRRVVAGVPHDEQVPPQPVPVQPGQGLRLHPGRAGGQQHDHQARVEQAEQAGDLLDERIVAAGLEEGVPVPPRALEVVLAAGGVGEHPVEVEHHRRAGGDRSVRQCQLPIDAAGLLMPPLNLGATNEPLGDIPEKRATGAGSIGRRTAASWSRARGGASPGASGRVTSVQRSMTTSRPIRRMRSALASQSTAGASTA